MLLPNKLITYNDSILPKLVIVLEELQKQSYEINVLYKKVIGSLSGVNEFIDILDCLYLLEKIEYDETEGVLHYVV